MPPKAYTIAEYLSEIKRKVGDESNYNWSDTAILEEINNGIRDIATRTDCCRDIYNFLPIEGADTYLVPEGTLTIFKFAINKDDGYVLTTSVSDFAAQTKAILVWGDQIKVTPATPKYPYTIKYSTGRVSVTNGSAVVTGTGTEFLANVNEGDFIQVSGDTAWYTIQEVNSDTQLTLTSEYTGNTASNIYYVITSRYTYSLTDGELWRSFLPDEVVIGGSNTLPVPYQWLVVPYVLGELYDEYGDLGLASKYKGQYEQGLATMNVKSKESVRKDRIISIRWV